MPFKKSGISDEQFMAEVRRERDLRMKGYREQALKLFPPVCGRCGREFEGKRLRELTVHHKDHNHDNNPPDGSNWELLCVYCHDNEHQRQAERAQGIDSGTRGEDAAPATHRPFAGLDELLKRGR